MRSPKAAKVTPTYMTGKKPMVIGLHDVVRAMKFIEEQGQLDALVKAAKKHKITMKIDAESVNFVKDFFVTKDLHDTAQIARHIVNAKGDAGSDEFECKFKKE